MVKDRVPPFTSLLAATFLSFCALLPAGTTTSGQSPWGARKPKLVVILVIDQLRYDYLERFRPQMVAGGFKRLLGGANFVNCRYDYAVAFTCPGHATLFTGAYSNVHGVIGNEWFDASRGGKVYCVEDADTRQVGGNAGPGYSPRNLIGSTIGDELRIASSFQSRVIAISLKDRSAVVPGGHTANAAYWYDGESGQFVTSSYYMQELPAWVSHFNSTEPGKAYCGKPWQAVAETPQAGGKVLSQAHLDPSQKCPNRDFLAWLRNTPFMNAIELGFASQAIKNEGLGQGPATDLLAISLSVNDSIGHIFGPYSDEVADTTVRTDRDLADFLGELDKTIGLDNVWITLSADHGAAPTPRFIKEHHLGPGNAVISAVRDAVEKALSQFYGPGQWVQDVSSFCITLNKSTLKKHQAEESKVLAVAAEAAASVPEVSAAFTRTQLLTGNLPRSPLGRKAANSFNSQRSGDVFLILDPYALPVAGETGSTHGAPWTYDTQVPLVLWGNAFKPGIYATQCEPIDLAPTLAVALGLTQPSGAQGKPLTTALKYIQ
ncbi:MAG TPA: alkaline phosphatase family protein [Terriglobia bacterium]|nr:alkaline phosphatase family protein [Terriglobia bacterium]